MRLYHQGSADLVDDAVPEGGAEVFLAGVAGREFTPDYWRRILQRLTPAVVVPCHHDDVFRPLDGPFALAPNVRLAAVPEEVESVGRTIEVVALSRETGRSNHSGKE
jgi:L-ascorbate metabolism protein UlaG (beta-lactamase superfamily)